MNVLERAERRVRQRWYDLALAESQRQPAEILQQRYERYITALHAYMALFEAASAGEEERIAS